MSGRDRLFEQFLRERTYVHNVTGEPSADQSGVGRSTESITSTSTGPVVDWSFRPSCSSTAVNSDGAFGSATPGGASSGVHDRSPSYRSMRPVRSTTSLPAQFDRWPARSAVE